MVFRGFVQARCQFVSLGLASGSKAAPAPCIEPILAVSGGINVDGVIVPELPADGVYAPAALLQRNVFALGDQQLSIETQGDESFPEKIPERRLLNLIMSQ